MRVYMKLHRIMMCGLLGLLIGQVTRLHLEDPSWSPWPEVLVSALALVWVASTVVDHWYAEKMRTLNEMNYRFDQAWTECMSRLVDVQRQYELGMIDLQQRDQGLATVQEAMKTVMGRWEKEFAAISPQRMVRKVLP